MVGPVNPPADPWASSRGVGETQYVRSGDGHVAFQVLSTGSVDILVVNESVMPIEALHENEHTAAYLARLTAWGRVIVFDRRGVGLSDSVAADAPLALQDWVDDAAAVLDAVGCERVAVFSCGPSAGLIALQLAATQPARISFLSVYDAIARYRWAPDYPCGVTDEVDMQIEARLRADWGTARFADRRGRFAATAARHPGFVDWATTWFRRGAGPATNAAQAMVLRAGDVRSALPAITCPTLIINHVEVEDGRYLAAHIAGARYVELHDPCHLLFSPELDEVMAVTGETFGGRQATPSPQRMLATMLAVDVAEAVSAEPGVVRRLIERFGGEEITTSTDGVVATFDGPTRAVLCGVAIRDAAGRRGATVRAAVHTGEVELCGRELRGVHVQVVRRLCALAGGAQVLVTQSVVDLVAGAELRFDHLGDLHLRGPHGRWSAFEASPSPLQLPATLPSPSSSRAVCGSLEDLSPREGEVLSAVATGASNAEIATALFVSEATVKAHVSHLLAKLRCTNRVQLALRAHHAGLAGGSAR
jgi:DNA-binding CsgD family transcriptional regulator/pimeloyl-ACP methyl ester carboxylesterase